MHIAGRQIQHAPAREMRVSRRYPDTGNPSATRAQEVALQYATHKVHIAGRQGQHPTGELRLAGRYSAVVAEPVGSRGRTGNGFIIARHLEDRAQAHRCRIHLFSQPFELLLGRRTYDIWAPYWPRIGADSPSHPIAGPFNSVRKHVATHRPDTLDWQNSHALEGDLANAVRALKRQDGTSVGLHPGALDQHA
jgi:hypothetical protein